MENTAQYAQLNPTAPPDYAHPPQQQYQQYPPQQQQQAPYPPQSYPQQPYPQQPQQQQSQYGQPTTIPAYNANPGPCGAGGAHQIREDFTCCGIFLGIFFFPIGLICCLTMKDRVCVRCGVKFA